MNCKGKNSLGPGSLVGKKRQKMGWKGVQKQLASERSEPSGGLAKGKGRRLFPPKSPARLTYLFLTLSILFFAFYPTKEPGPRLGDKLNRKETEATYAAAKKKSCKKILAYTGFKYYLCN